VRLAWWRLRRLIRLLAFRPFPAVLLFGGVALASNALWFGTGLFIGPLPGAVITLLTGLGLAGAVFMLRRGRCQMAALGVLVGFAVLVPAMALIAYRLKTGLPILMHDGAYQTEEAMRALLTNHDPYGLDYAQTSMRRWHWYVNASLHPSLFHYVYPPLTFLLPLPFFAAAQALGLAFDVRLVFLVTAGLAAWGIVRLPWRWEWRYLCLVALFLDPFFYLPQGRNDILFLGALVGAVLAWERSWPVVACAGVGLALAFKPFALFFVLLLAVMLVRGRQREGWSAWQLGFGLAVLLLPSWRPPPPSCGGTRARTGMTRSQSWPAPTRAVFPSRGTACPAYWWRSTCFRDRTPAFPSAWWRPRLASRSWRSASAGCWPGPCCRRC